MAKYYFAEVQNANSHREAEPLESDNLNDATSEALEKSVFQGTVLKIGTEIIEDNKFLHPAHIVAVKYPGEPWDIADGRAIFM